MSRVLRWGAVVFLPNDLGHQKFGGLFLWKKRQNVMAVTDFLALFWQEPEN